jgi:hypothetical protein
MNAIVTIRTFGYLAKPMTHGKENFIPLLLFQRFHQGLSEINCEDLKMKKVLALIVVATMGLSSVAFAAGKTTSTPTITSTTAAPASEKAASAKATHKKHKATEQKAQAAKKTVKKVPAQKAQAAKKHHKTTKKTVAAPAA